MAAKTLKKTTRAIERFDVYWVTLDPTQGHEMKKTRPCVIVSPNDLNRSLETVIVAPLTSTTRQYGYRMVASLAGRKGTVALDQIRCVDKARLHKPLGRLDQKSAMQALSILGEMFAW